MGAALRRERAAQQPRGFSVDANNAGAASRPFRDARPLPQAGVQLQPSAVSRNIITANPPINPG
ncbi:hypothetical protein DM819_25405 [Pseudomonas hunanensis]|uniref:Uncharacterized protein n=1 Tax=Pseudomonas hunanensis TaxID=1247546 RepID=A0ABD6N772_9PSED|nr:hypothetical protein [Pseudomonas hunanensis]